MDMTYDTAPGVLVCLSQAARSTLIFCSSLVNFNSPDHATMDVGLLCHERNVPTIMGYGSANLPVYKYMNIFVLA